MSLNKTGIVIVELVSSACISYISFHLASCGEEEKNEQGTQFFPAKYFNMGIPIVSTKESLRSSLRRRLL